MAAKGYTVINRDLCKGCHLCLLVCPRKIMEVDAELNKKGYLPARQKKVEDEKKACTGCAACATVCPEVAIEVYRAQ